eukprot:14948267-Heterocapsa_arctica.AAC.1
MDTFILAASIARTLSRILRPEMKPCWRSEMSLETIGSISSRQEQQRIRLSVFTRERGLVMAGV